MLGIGMWAFLCTLATLSMTIGTGLSHASERSVRAAIASNFQLAARALIADYHQRTGARVVASYGSTGQLYAQITQGAPFDVFLAADRRRPARAVAGGHGVQGTQRTYAIGRLALYSRSLPTVDPIATLRAQEFKRIAIANPTTAPYGAGAMQLLERIGIAQQISGRVVRGQNVAQAFQFAVTGNVAVALVSVSLVQREPPETWAPISRTYHAPIAQDVVLLKRARNEDAARRFLDYLLSAPARAVIGKLGYDLPLATR